MPDRRRTNIVESPTAFLGRSADLQALSDFFERGDRIVTLVGAPGSGKTRLASRYGGGHCATLLQAGGVWACDVTEARTAADVVSSVASTLGESLARSPDDSSALDQLGQAIAARGPLLLILDNCDQAITSAAEVVWRWHGLAPEARFLITSRERLDVPAERVHELAPLTLPTGDEDASASEAVQLFLDRTRLVRPDYELTEREAPSVAELVRKLDGLPLAIELAAARMRLFDAQTMLGRLGNRMQTLAHSSRKEVGHHRTLRAALDWSWTLLEEWERATLRQCSTFAGGFSMEAIESVVDLTSFPDAPAVLDVVQSLRDKSLVRAQPGAKPPSELRLGLYESVRDYAHEKLVESGEQAGAEARHARYFLESGAQWARHAELGVVESARHLAMELENLRLVHARAKGPEEALRALLVIDRAVWLRGPYADHLSRLDAAVLLAERCASATHAELLVRRAALRLRCGRPREARLDADAAVGLSQRAGADAIEGHAHRLRAQIDSHLGDRGKCLDDYQAALEAFRRAGRPEWEARVLFNMGGHHHAEGALDPARAHYMQAIALAEANGNILTLLLARAALGTLLQELGRLSEAEAALRAVVADYDRMDDAVGRAMAILSLGSVLLERRDLDAAEGCYREGLATLERLGSRRWVGPALSVLGALRATRDDVAEAESLLDRADAELVSAAGHVRAIADVCHGHLELALARRCRAQGDAARADAHHAAAEQRLAAGASQPVSIDELRTALRLLEEALAASVGASTPADTVLLAADGSWFRMPRRWRIEVAQPHLRAVLRALVQARLEAPGRALAIDELLAAAWPGERVVPRARANRVYVAISRLRELGLRDLIRSSEGAYSLDPSVPIAQASRSRPSLSGEP